MNATMNTACGRCADFGMGSFSHIAGGKCFACGRVYPAKWIEDEKARERKASTRADNIRELHSHILSAFNSLTDPGGSRRKLTPFPEWLARHGAEIRALLAAADADVRARAEARFAEVGILEFINT